MEERQSLGPYRGQDVVAATARASERLGLLAADPLRLSHVPPQHDVAVQRQAQQEEKQKTAPPLRVTLVPEQLASAAQRQAAEELARRSSARVSSRASVVVELAQVRSGRSRGKQKEALLASAQRVAQALDSLASLQDQNHPDLDQLAVLVEQIDEDQSLLFDSLPEPSPSLTRRSTVTRDSVRQSQQRGSTVVKLFEKAKGTRKPNAKLIEAAEAVAESLEELTALEDDPSAADDELAILVDQATRQQRQLLTLTKDPHNFQDDMDDDFDNEF